jgi:hypothetical protein
VATARPGAAAALSLVKGAPTRGVVGRIIDGGLELRVTDRAGNPVPEAAVSLRPAAGSVDQRLVASDSSGRVGLAWTLGPVAGPQRLAASVPGVERPLEIIVQARAGGATRLVIEGLPTSAPAGALLAKPVAVTVTDSFRNPVAGAQVTFASRSGKLSPARARTDSTGRAQVRWTLGPTAGEQRLEVVEKASGRRATATVRAAAAKSRKR